MHELIVAMFTILRLCENSTVDNLEEQAIGGYQIRPVFVKDVNRIAGTEFTHEDARNDRLAQQMIYIYLKHYGERYRLKTGKEPDARVLGMLHNGGPSGYLNKTKTALDYGERCSNLYLQWRLENR